MTRNDLAHAFGRIVDALARLERIALLARLRPGCEATSILSAFTARGLSVPPGLLELLGSHDGTDVRGDVTLDEIHLFPGFYLLGLADAISNYDAFEDDARWNPAWLPIFANGGGDFYALVCDDAHEDYGGIVHFRIEDSYHPIEFASLEAMLQTLAAAFDRAVFYVDANGYLEMDDMQFAALAASLNADVPYWSE
jgi:cell wall assembly regulator SMI1